MLYTYDLNSRTSFEEMERIIGVTRGDVVGRGAVVAIVGLGSREDDEEAGRGGEDEGRALARRNGWGFATSSVGRDGGVKGVVEDAVRRRLGVDVVGRDGEDEEGGRWSCCVC